MITGIIIAAVLVGGVGLFIGLFLGVAGKKFEVEVNEKEIQVREELPGNNLSGRRFCRSSKDCGYYGSGSGRSCPYDCVCKVRRGLRKSRTEL